MVNAGVLPTDITDYYSTYFSIPTNTNIETNENVFIIIDHDKLQFFLSEKKGKSFIPKVIQMKAIMNFIK